MQDKPTYSRSQTFVLVLLRLVIGYHFLFEGLDKLFSENWTAVPFLLHSNWIFASLFKYLATDQTILSFVNYLNIWGQILIGISLIVGLCSRTFAILGAVMILSYYIAIPPFIETFTFIDKNLFEFFGFLVIVLFPTSSIFGLDLLVAKYRGRNEQ